MRTLVLTLVACSMVLSTTAVADKKDKGDTWVPPGLSQEERAEWRDGRPPGWSQGQKKGWRGRSCPPGQAKKGRCPDGPAAASMTSTPGQLDPIQAAIERIREWARNRRIGAGVLDAMLVGFHGAVHYGVPVPVAEKFVMAAADRSIPAAGIEVLTRALAYGVRRGVPPDHLQQFAANGWSAGVPPDSIALGLYRLGAEARR